MHTHKCTRTTHTQMHTCHPDAHTKRASTHTTTQALDELTTHLHIPHTHATHAPQRHTDFIHHTHTPYNTLHEYHTCAHVHILACTQEHRHANTDTYVCAHSCQHFPPRGGDKRGPWSCSKYPKSLTRLAAPTAGPSQAPAPVSLLGAPVLSIWCRPRVSHPPQGSGWRAG